MDLNSLQELPLPITIQVLSITNGRMRLRIPSELRQTHMMTQVASTLQAFFPEIEDVRINPAIGSITIYYGGDIDSFEEILTKLESFGIVIGTNPSSSMKSQAIIAIANAWNEFKQSINSGKNSYSNLRLLFPLILALILLRQWLVKGSPLKASPWYLLAWYVFDSFLKLKNTEAPQAPGNEESSNIN